MTDWQTHVNCLIPEVGATIRDSELFKAKIEYSVKASKSLIEGDYVAVDLLFQVCVVGWGGARNSEEGGGACACACMCACACVCVCVCTCVRAYVCVCMCPRTCVCARTRAHVCMCCAVLCCAVVR